MCSKTQLHQRITLCDQGTSKRTVSDVSMSQQGIKPRCGVHFSRLLCELARYPQFSRNLLNLIECLRKIWSVVCLKTTAKVSHTHT